VRNQWVTVQRRKPRHENVYIRGVGVKGLPHGRTSERRAHEAGDLTRAPTAPLKCAAERRKDVRVAARVVYYHPHSDGTILFVYSKAQAANPSPAHQKIVRGLIQEL
jgi:hypothetical protein